MKNVRLTHARNVNNKNQNHNAYNSMGNGQYIFSIVEHESVHNSMARYTVCERYGWLISIHWSTDQITYFLLTTCCAEHIFVFSVEPKWLYFNCILYTIPSQHDFDHNQNIFFSSLVPTFFRFLTAFSYWLKLQYSLWIYFIGILLAFRFCIHSTESTGMGSILRIDKVNATWCNTRANHSHAAIDSFFVAHSVKLSVVCAGAVQRTASEPNDKSPLKC